MKTEENDPHLFVSRQSKAWAEFRRRLAESGVSAGQKVLGKAIGRMAGERRAHVGAKGKRERQKRNPGRSSNVPGNFDGAPGRIRTHDPLVRSQVLYPTELLAHNQIRRSRILRALSKKSKSSSKKKSGRSFFVRISVRRSADLCRRRALRRSPEAAKSGFSGFGFSRPCGR